MIAAGSGHADKLTIGDIPCAAEGRRTNRCAPGAVGIEGECSRGTSAGIRKGFAGYLTGSKCPCLGASTTARQQQYRKAQNHKDQATELQHAFHGSAPYSVW